MHSYLHPNSGGMSLSNADLKFVQRICQKETEWGRIVRTKERIPKTSFCKSRIMADFGTQQKKHPKKQPNNQKKKTKQHPPKEHQKKKKNPQNTKTKTPNTTQTPKTTKTNTKKKKNKTNKTQKKNHNQKTQKQNKPTPNSREAALWGEGAIATKVPYKERSCQTRREEYTRRKLTFTYYGESRSKPPGLAWDLSADRHNRISAANRQTKAENARKKNDGMGLVQQDHAAR